ncbi:flippase-like domain-containing protein [Candidatus Poribacteria bacterium]|nr:flippase-like domain-containing protein [Candidatus Poribacteria bacterium]
MDVIAGHLLLWICQGVAFFLFVQSFASVQWADAGVLTACFAFAWIIGFLSFLTPGGLGIREGLLGLLLANYMPAPQAVLVALLCRVWMLSAEIVLAGVAFALDRKQRDV